MNLPGTSGLPLPKQELVPSCYISPTMLTMMVRQNQVQLGSNPKAKHMKYFKIQVFWLSTLTDHSKSYNPAPPVLSVVPSRLQRTRNEQHSLMFNLCEFLFRGGSFLWFILKLVDCSHFLSPLFLEHSS